MRGILDLFRGQDMADYLLKLNRGSIRDEDHPLFIRSGAVADTYWSRRVRQFIARPDFERAWDELNKAAKGFLRAGFKMDDFGNDFETAMHPEYRCWFASRSLIGELAGELHDAMVNAGIIVHFTDEHYVLKDTRIGVTVYEIKQPRAHRREPRQYSQHVEVSGLRLAQQFKDMEKTRVLHQLREQQLNDPSMMQSEYNWDAAVFIRPGGCILMIAEHFRRVENERRRLKHERAHVEYEASRTSAKKPRH